MDPGFEQQTATGGGPLVLPWYSEGPATIGSDDWSGGGATSKNGPHGGNRDGYIYAPASGTWSDIAQTVSVAPNTNYVLTAWVQNSNDAGFSGGALGARTPSGSVLRQTAIPMSATYGQLSVSFNSGGNGSVVVYAGFAPSGAAWMHLDDVSLTSGTCVPTTCQTQGANCGSIPDNCGGTLPCGTCTTPQTCGGGGTSNVCGSASRGRGADGNTPQVVFPSDSSVIDIRSAGAVGDGVHDDTAIIQNAINTAPPSAVIYFSNGTYLVSSPLLWRGISGTWRAYLTLQGQSQSRTIIKLKDNLGGAWSSPGACQPSYSTTPSAAPNCVSQAVIYTGSQNETVWDGNGNEGYNNFVFDLTIDVGRGNAGAEGIHWIGHNSSAIRNVTVSSDDGGGWIGIDMRTQYFGPAFGKNITVKGFQYGLAIDRSFSSVTLEHITLQNQQTAGFDLRQNIASIRDLVSVNSVPVIRIVGSAALVLLDSDLSGGASGNAALNFTSADQVYLRNVSTTGYGSVAKKDGAVVASAPSVVEYSSSGPFAAISPQPHALMLPIQETPEYSDTNLANWANVMSYSAFGDGIHDDSAAIQAAIDSGKSTIYFPRGNYVVNEEVMVRGNVCMLRGFGAGAQFSGSAPFTFKLLNTMCSSLTVEQIGTASLEGASTGTVALKDFRLVSYSTTAGWSGGGSVFMEDTSFGHYFFTRQNAWARQFNPENRSEHAMNDGGTLWILGIKTENPGAGNTPSSILESRNGAKSEVLGGYHSTQGTNNISTINGTINCGQQGNAACPMYISTDSSVTVFAVADWVWWSPSLYVSRSGSVGTIDAPSLPSGRPGPFYWFMNDY
jgi:hypothetical protein